MDGNTLGVPRGSQVRGSESPAVTTAGAKASSAAGIGPTQSGGRGSESPAVIRESESLACVGESQVSIGTSRSRKRSSPLVAGHSEGGRTGAPLSLTAPRAQSSDQAMGDQLSVVVAKPDTSVAAFSGLQAITAIELWARTTSR